jgi:cytochrome c-type biogenesis protein CcmH
MIRKRSLILTPILLAAACSPIVAMRVAAQQSDRAKQIGGKFMCMCGCNQVLTQCNHVGCTTSTAMLKEPVLPRSAAQLYPSKNRLV